MTLPADVPGPEHTHYTGWVHRAALRSMGRNVLLAGRSLEHQHDDVTHDHPGGYLTHKHALFGKPRSTATSTWEKP